MANKSKNRKSFYLIMISLPLLFLLLLEGLLRLVSFGTSYPLFIESAELKGYMQPNPHIIKRFFSHPNLAPDIQPDTFYFKSKKPDNSYRIVIQGGSSAAGFPFGRFGSLQGMLQQRFKRLYPDKEIEVISTAMSAINSYALLDFTDEIIELDPDLILIYAGHNEYLGIMGIGSSYAVKGDRAASLLFLSLKELRIFQLIQYIVNIFNREIENSDESNSERTLMANIAGNKEIVLNSETYQKGIEQFEQNLELILDKYQSKNIPVIIGTLASNEKDQPPFASTQSEYSASSLYNQAKELESDNKISKARKMYINAKDRDLLRFRAPSYFNQIIKRQAQKEYIYLADVQDEIRKHSDNRIIGFKHMYEHLHPNASGYFLLSEAYVDVIVKNKFISKDVSNYSREEAWKDVPLTKMDILVADYKIKRLMADYPFKTRKKEVEFGKIDSYEKQLALQKFKGESWLNLQQELLAHYQRSTSKDYSQAAKVAGILFDSIPNNAQTAWVAGQLYLENNDPKMALYYHYKAVSLEPNSTTYLMSLAYSSYLNNQKENSLNYLNQVISLKPSHQIAAKQKQRIEQELKNEQKTNQ